jgi:anti-sigma regulatory factor (Ser/Thr protein kinase)
MDEPRKIIVDDQSLNAVTIDNLLEKVDMFSKENGSSPIEIDLQKVNFVDPYGLVALCLVGRFLKSKCDEISIILPNNLDCQGYLHTANFISLVENFVQIKNRLPGAESVHRLTDDVVLELTKIEKKDKEANNDVNKILERLSTILQSQLNFDEQEIANFSNLISELCHNIKDHSEDEGFVAVQRYQRKRDGKRYVVIGVGDLGIGIKSSLGKRYDVSGWSHIDAIVQALKKEVSSIPNRGFGLYMVSRITQDYKGALHIRSGDARLYLRYAPRGERTVLFPGTQVSINLSEIGKNN